MSSPAVSFNDALPKDSDSLWLRELKLQYLFKVKEWRDAIYYKKPESEIAGLDKQVTALTYLLNEELKGEV